MDLQQLRCFLAVAQEGHFGRAAARLHLTTSPVSRSVKELERELGGDLFVRRYHQVELTAAGRRLLSRAEPIVAELDDLRSEVRRLARSAARTLHIGGTHLAPAAVLDAVVEAVEKSDPDRPLDVTLAPSAELLPAVASGEIDLAVVHLPVDDPTFGVLPLATYAIVAVLRSDDPLATRPTLRTADLADHTFVTMDDSVQPTAMQHMRAELRARGVVRVETVPAADVMMIAAKVRRRGSVAFVPHDGDVGRIFVDPRFIRVPVVDAPSLEVGVVWRDGGDVVGETLSAIVAQLAPPATGSGATREATRGPKPCA
ncbi:LysR family transcriptional regulator [Pseudonocardia oroxyli]|uniref:Transcriptional regulator, LysR family n=1 Tax=Pseudonocardia oroxyli TaxID=366584 RepID=A0A1G7TWQ9_PSEOR|nr:LysR family transcriptional regulator [Pseudonocardia oroxyli]SDG38940.1 transcriptional regulator, LysR family [Pseudonocardia oroxyli]